MAKKLVKKAGSVAVKKKTTSIAAKAATKVVAKPAPKKTDTKTTSHSSPPMKNKPAGGGKSSLSAKSIKTPVAKATSAKTNPTSGKPAAGKSEKTPAAKPTVLPAKATATPPTAKSAKITHPKNAMTKVLPAKTAAPNAIVIKIDPAKAGRPQLLQGPIAVRPMGKKATLPVTPEKPKAKAVKKRLPLSNEPAFVVVQPPTKAVATSEKAAKNKAGLSQKDLDFFRDLLLAKRRELVGDMSSMEREALREGSSDLSNLPVHMADQGTDAYEQEFTLHLVEKDRTLLRELNDALAKIQNGTYGICEGTGLPISKPRLEAQPWARHSIEHARALEKRAGMFRR